MGGGDAQNQQRPVRMKKRERGKGGRRGWGWGDLLCKPGWEERDSRSVERWETKVSARFIP